MLPRLGGELHGALLPHVGARAIALVDRVDGLPVDLHPDERRVRAQVDPEGQGVGRPLRQVEQLLEQRLAQTDSVDGVLLRDLEVAAPVLGVGCLAEDVFRAVGDERAPWVDAAFEVAILEDQRGGRGAG